MDIDSLDKAVHEMLSSNYNVVEYGSSEIELNDDNEEFDALVDMLTLQIALSVISDLNLPDLRERLNRAHAALLDIQSKEMQDDPFNEELLGGIVERIMSMRDTK